MDLKRIIKYFYIGYTIYVIFAVSATNIDFITILPSILLMWLNYFLFIAGYSMYKRKNKIHNNFQDSGWLNKRSRFTLVTIALLSILFSLLSVNYYTGQTPISIYRNLANNVSIYYEYQNYFMQQQRNVLSITKIPYVLMLFYLKFMMFYSYVSVFLGKNKTNKFDLMYIFTISVSFLYVGIARGTNFEFFEFVMLIIFVIFSKKSKGKNRVPVRNIVISGIVISIMIFIFYSGITARGSGFNYQISRDIFFDPNGILPNISSFMSFVVIILFGYFGFGFYYISIYIRDMWFVSLSDFFTGLIPFGYVMEGNGSLNETMKNLVDMGARWQPDSAAYINLYGYIGLLFLCFLLGLFSKLFEINDSRNPMTKLTSFIVLLQMVSLPVGNFVSVSSASQLLIITVITYWIWKIFIRKKIRLRIIK